MIPAPPRRTGRRTRVGTAEVAYVLATVAAGVWALWTPVAITTDLPGWWWPLAMAIGLWLVGMAAEQGERVSVSRYRRDNAAPKGGSERGIGPFRRATAASRRYRDTARGQR